VFDTKDAERSEAINRLKAAMLIFSWDEVPGNDSGRLLKFLKQEFGISWVETAKIEKIHNDKEIRVSAGKNHLSLKLNDEKTKVKLKIDDGRTVEFIAKSEDGKLNIYESSESETDADAEEPQGKLRWNILLDRLRL
jgi:hypothetical protein